MNEEVSTHSNAYSCNKGIRSEAHLNSLDEVLVNFLRSLFRVDSNDRVGVLLEHVLHEATVLEQLLLNDRVLVLRLVLQPSKNGLVPYVLTQDVVVLVCYGVEAPLLQLLVDQVVTHVEGDDKTWLQIELLKHADLVYRRGGSLEDPAVGLAVRHFQALSEAPNHMVIRYHVAILEHLAQIVSLLTLASDEVFDELVGVYVNQLVLAGQSGGMLPQVHTGRPHHDYLRRLARSVAVFEGQETRHLLDDFLLALVPVYLNYIAHELLFDALDVYVVLCDCVPGDAV